MNDQQLIVCYLDGDERAFEELLNRHQQKIYTSIYLFVKDQSLAEDIFQDVFIKILDTLRKGMCVDHFRGNKRRPQVSPTETFDIFDVLQSHDDNAEQAIMRSQTHDKVRQLVDMLPPEQREVVILRHYADMSFKEIAALTRVSINTALGRMRYALINIRKMMAEKEVVLQ